MYKRYAFIAVFVSFLIYFTGCTKKDDKTDVNKNDTSKSSQLIKKDSVTGKQKVFLKYEPKKGDIFRYRMTAKNTNSEKSFATENKEVTDNDESSYYYTKEVQDVDQSGIITFKVTFDSIMVSMNSGDKSIAYNSNVNDTIKSKPAFIQYNAVIKEPFFVRVKPEGDISDVYGLEKIQDNLFKALGDTLKEADKSQIREQNKGQIQGILQQEYQTFPKQEVFMDSSWTKSMESQVLVFDVQNNAKYTLKGIENKNNQNFANIDATLDIVFINREVKEKGVKLNIENAETNGTGKIVFNIDRGCVTSKETSITLSVQMKMAAQGQSANSEQKLITNLSITLL